MDIQKKYNGYTEYTNECSDCGFSYVMKLLTVYAVYITIWWNMIFFYSQVQNIIKHNKLMCMF